MCGDVKSLTNELISQEKAMLKQVKKDAKQNILVSYTYDIKQIVVKTCTDLTAIILNEKIDNLLRKETKNE